MHFKSFLVLSCIFEWIVVVLATCTVYKYQGGSGEGIQCSNTTLSTALDQGTTAIQAIMIFKSQLPYIPERAFAKHAKTLQSLNIHQCRISDIHWDAFGGLNYLKKLSLPNNNITLVKDGWFKDLTSLEQLDLSFNMITNIEPIVFSSLHTLKRLDLGENRLTCFNPITFQFMPGIEKFRFSGNPLSFRCRGKLTLWLRDHGINSKGDEEEENWLDSLLWLCAIDDPQVAESEVLMKECVILNLFNQLRTGLTTAQSYPLNVSQDCIYSRNLLTNCVANTARITDTGKLTNGNVIKRLLLYLREAKSAN